MTVQPRSLAQCEVTIVGLGLMGGSAAQALRGKCRRIVGVDVNPATVNLALRQGWIDGEATFEAGHDCDVLVLAAPVRTILAQLEALTTSSFYPPRQTVLVDFGSTKAAIVRAMADLPPRFEPVGGHPMCGKEVNGLAHAEPGLFVDRPFVLCPPGYTSVQALGLVYEFVQALGAEPLMMPPERHDRLVALISHLPYAAAVALMRAVIAQDDDDAWQLAASGFRDTSRLAGSDLAMMTDILLTNREAVLSALQAYRTELDGLEAAIRQGQPEPIRAALAPAQAKRAQLFK